MRYKLRSSIPPRLSEPRGSNSEYPTSSDPATGKSGGGTVQSKKRTHRRKTHITKTETLATLVKKELTPNIFVLPQEIIILFVEILDVDSCLSLYRTCKRFHDMLQGSESFWRLLSLKSEFSSHSCLEQLPTQRLGYAGQKMYLDREEEEGLGVWSTCWKRGVKMRRNIVASNFQGWRLYSNKNCPVAELSPTLDLNSIKQQLGDFPRLSHNDDLKIDWDDKYLVLFHFFRGETESCTIRLWDIEDEPKFLYEVEKGIECITDKVSVHAGYVVIVPSWPLEAGALVMTLDINNKMEEKGKYLFNDE
ncbi:uncharacterized protein LOC111703520, partial [Eurytemora carolleeae]|uniref:uncharacterized protein LOC111703520 n=1 Tax=Eurytemora carolleeae TaxID=1294199 RepID=UPI000C790B1C